MGAAGRGSWLRGNALVVSDVRVLGEAIPKALTTSQGGPPVPIPQRGVPRPPGDWLCPPPWIRAPLSETCSFSLLEFRNVHFTNPIPSLPPRRRSRAGPTWCATSQAIFGPCLSYRHPSTSNRWWDHPTVPPAQEEGAPGSAWGWNPSVPGVWFQPCPPFGTYITISLRTGQCGSVVRVLAAH